MLSRGKGPISSGHRSERLGDESLCYGRDDLCLKVAATALLIDKIQSVIL